MCGMYDSFRRFSILYILELLEVSPGRILEAIVK